MYKESEMQGSPYLVVLRLQNKYKNYWHEKSDAYWFWRLLQEVIELGFSLVGLHKDPSKWEKMQIAAICINWMYLREPKSH